MSIPSEVIAQTDIQTDKQAYTQTLRKHPGNTLADLGSVPGARPPPQGSRFFRFDILNFRNVTASGVHVPPTGNPGSATVITGHQRPLRLWPMPNTGYKRVFV